MTQLFDYLSEKYPQQSIDEVNRRLLELSSLFEISQLINESLELRRVLNNVMLIPMGRMMISRGGIILKQDGQYKVVMAKGISKALQETVFDQKDIPEDCFTPQHFEKMGERCPPKLKAFVEESRLELGVPFVNNNQLLGFMMFGAKLTKNEFSDDEVNFLNSLANMSATTIDNALQLEEIKQINRQLDEKVQELRTLFDIARGLSATLDAQKILRLLIYAVMGQMLITKYALLLKRDDHLVRQESRGFKSDLLEGLYPELLALKLPESAIAVSEIKNERLKQLLQKQEVETLIPMQHQEKLIGYLLLGKKISGQTYTETDREFLSTLVSQAVTSLENARLFEETLEKQRLEEELNVARNIQKKLLPKTIPALDGYDLYGMNASSKQVGGDYFDIIPIDDRRIALAIADVSGKGVPASLLMANLQAALRVLVKVGLPIEEVVSRLNKLIYDNTGMDKFITFFVAILDKATNNIEYVNAGHNNPILLRADGTMEFLDIGGLILGVLPVYTYETGNITLRKGDLLLSYTDGVNEAVNADGEEWGEDPLYELVSSAPKNQPVQQLVEKILTAIESFADGEPQADDVTMLAIRRLG